MDAIIILRLIIIQLGSNGIKNENTILTYALYKLYNVKFFNDIHIQWSQKITFNIRVKSTLFFKNIVKMHYFSIIRKII